MVQSRKKTATTALLAVTLSVGFSHAASFDCTKALTPTDYTICDNPQLSSLGQQTAGLYYTLISDGAPQATASVADVMKQPKAFIKKYNQCDAN